MALAVDANGSAYVAGLTDSFDFPATNPVQNFNGGGNDVFVAKLSPGGNALVNAQGSTYRRLRRLPLEFVPVTQ